LWQQGEGFGEAGGGGVIAVIPVDEVGSFPVRPIPGCSFRLRWRPGDGSDVLTGWITL
jgi:hypothetical protein